MRKSINRTTVIIVLAIFLTISVGYALFSDTITIEGTATAQGNFDIETSCITSLTEQQKNIAFGEYDENHNDRISDSGYENEMCTAVDDKVTYSVALKYPGASKLWLIKFENTGDIDAKVYLGDIESLGDYTVNAYDSLTNEFINDGGPIYFSFAECFFETINGEYIGLNTEDAFSNFIDESGENIILHPGQSFYAALVYKWSNDDTQKNEYYKLVQNATLNWVQAVGN